MENQSHIANPVAQSQQPAAAVLPVREAVMPRVPIQCSLTVGTPDDPLEHDADNMADKVMRMPLSPLYLGRGAGGETIQRKCAACEEEEKAQRKPLSASITPFIQTKSTGEGTTSASLSNKINSSRGSGSSMDDGTRTFMENRFGSDFSSVKIHTGSESVMMNRELNAKAFTVGNDIYFNEGQYNPQNDSGKHLLAHELTHTIQQNNSGSLIQRSWEIQPRTTANPLRPGGLTDEQILENAFSEICPLTSRTGNIISVLPGPPTANRMEGCRCLMDIEAAIGTPAITSNPKVSIEPNGWSRTSVGGGSLEVSVRHPDDPFSWGYWTGTTATHPTETRHVKPFWQTLAHEICGHGATFARSTGASFGARGSSTGHNDAIIGENLLAAEHGVTTDEQRGLDINPATGTPMPGHRGESFLQAAIPGFAHAGFIPPASAAAVISSVVDSINTSAATGLDLMIQVEGRAFGNEGGVALAANRAAAIRSQIIARLRSAHISLTVPTGSRFHPNQVTIMPGSSVPGTTNADRSVLVYLFHRTHSAAP